MKTFHVITIFPELIEEYVKSSLLGKARAKKILSVEAVNLRDFARGRHAKARPTNERSWSFGRVDDSPYGGGPGMVIGVEAVSRAVAALKGKLKTRVILFSTRGKIFDQKAARRLARYDRLILIAGRYEGVDERVAAHVADEELSIGNFVLSGGELPALVVIEAVARHFPGVLGKQESLEEEKGSYPVYTRPAVFIPKKGVKWKVPEVLMKGHHVEIAKWRSRFGKRV